MQADERPAGEPTGGDAGPSSSAYDALGPAQLLEAVEKIHKGFNPASMTLDTYLELALKQHRVLNEDSRSFIQQVVYGIIRYEKFLVSILKSFFYFRSAQANRSQVEIYKIMAYLLVFRIDELGFQQFRRLVSATDQVTMTAYFKYLYDEEMLKGPIRDDWLKLYDKQFVDDTIAAMLGRNSEMLPLIHELELIVYNAAAASAAGDEAAGATGGSGGGGGDGSQSARRSSSTQRRAPTVPQPFNITAPRPRPPVMPEQVPPAPRPKPPPKVREGPTKEQLALEEARARNRRMSLAKYQEAAPFKLATLERPSNLEKVKAEIEAQRAQDQTFRAPTARPVPPPPTAEVRLNAAAILREDAVYKRRQAEEAELIRRYEFELHDTASWKVRVAELAALDDKAHKERLEKLRAEMAAAAANAVAAKERQVRDNLELGRRMKEETKRIEEDKAKEREEATKVNQQRREAILADKDNIRAVQEKLVLERRAAAEEERRKQVEDAKARAEAEAREMAERRDIIMQLRALEKVPKKRVAVFDPTEVIDQGLESQMSLVELRERLRIAKEREREEEERQRAAILQARLEREQMLLEKAANIQRVRRLASAQAKSRKADRADAAAQRADAARLVHEQQVLKVDSTLDAKRKAQAAEKARIAADEKKIKFELMQAAASAAVVEEARFTSIREGAKHTAARRQSDAIKIAGKRDEMLARAQTLRMKNIKQELRDRSAFLAEYDTKMAELARQTEAAKQTELMQKSQLVGTIRSHEAEQKARHQAAAFVPFTAGATNMAAKLEAIRLGTAQL